MNHEEYWKSRIDNVFDENYHKNALKKLYREAYKENEKQILKLYDELKEKGKLTTTQLYQIDRFMSLRKELEKQAEEVNSALNKQLTKDLKKAYKDTFGECIEEFGLNATWGTQNIKMLNKVLNTKWAGNNYSRRIWNNSKQLSKDIEVSIVDCLTRGTNKDVYVKAIKNKYNVGFSKADRLVRTELMHTINEGQRDTYKACGIKKVKWYAAEDERMCKICGSMHEKIYDIDEVPSVAHANCRCTLSPVVESLEKGKNNVKTIDNSKESDIIKAGGISGARNPYGEKAQEHADRYYGLIRSMKTDVSKIAKTTGFSEDKIQAVKDFIFNEKHDLGGTEKEYFQPDYMMSESWKRLINGKPEPHDITLIKHEITERDLMKKGFSQSEAHIMASEKYNYAKEAAEFYDRIEKYKD